jgi:hypothetical protein
MADDSGFSTHSQLPRHELMAAYASSVRLRFMTLSDRMKSAHQQQHFSVSSKFRNGWRHGRAVDRSSRSWSSSTLAKKSPRTPAVGISPHCRPCLDAIEEWDRSQVAGAYSTPLGSSADHLTIGHQHHFPACADSGHGHCLRGHPTHLM